MANKTGYDDTTTIDTVITSGLDSLADGGRAISPAQANSEKDLFGDVEISLKYTSSAPAAGTKAGDLYCLVSADGGTTYPEGGTSLTPQKALCVGAPESRNGSTSAFEVLSVPGLSIPARHHKWLFVNTSGKTLASSGNTIRVKRYKLDNNL